MARTFANGSGNFVDIIKNLQTFVGVLSNSNVQLVQFNDRLASLTSVLDDNKSDLDAALTDLSSATGEVQRFIAGSRDQTAEQIARLADLTQILVDNKMALQNVLHVAPNALANGYNDYDPDVGNIRGGVGIQNFSNPTYAYCSQFGALETNTGVETGKLCGLYLSPALKVFNPLLIFNFNYLPLPVNPLLAPRVRREKRHLHRGPAEAERGGPEAGARPSCRPRCPHIVACRVTLRTRRRRRRRRGGYRERRCLSRRRRACRSSRRRLRRTCRTCCCRPKGRSHDRPSRHAASASSSAAA